MFDVIILASGKSSRMRSATHKILHKIGNGCIINFIVNRCITLDCKINIVVPDDNAILESETMKNLRDSGVNLITEKNPRGTGASLEYAMQYTKCEDIVVLYGDTPFIPESVIRQLHESQNECFVTCDLPQHHNDEKYGRVIKTDGKYNIVEYKDADSEQRNIRTVNAGAYKFKRQNLIKILPEISCNNSQKEKYLTDVINHQYMSNIVAIHHCNYNDFMGINTIEDLVVAEQYFQQEKRKEFIGRGIYIQDPNTTYFSYDTTFISDGQHIDITIEPHCYFGENVTIESDCIIKAGCYLENCRIMSGAIVGPFARVRGGCQIGREAQIGNFVEIKSSSIGKRSKIKHLSYVGDCSVGEQSNIGAGTITCNYDGFVKSKSSIGGGSIIGSNCSIISPVSIGDKAIIAADTVVDKDIPDKALAISRPNLEIKKEYYDTYVKKRTK